MMSDDDDTHVLMCIYLSVYVCAYSVCMVWVYAMHVCMVCMCVYICMFKLKDTHTQNKLIIMIIIIS